MKNSIYKKEDSEYLKNNPTWHVEDSFWKAQQIMKLLNRNQISPKTIAEVGCGAGEVLNQLYLSLPGDIQLRGYDISIDAIKIAKKREKDRLKYSNEDFLKINRKFDLLLVIDVLEHVDDYLSFIKFCKNRAKNIIFHIPLDISVQGILRNKLIAFRNHLGHLHYFVKETALATLVDNGYEIDDYLYTTGSLNLKRKTFKSKLAILPRRIMFKINKDFAAKTLGGFSLLVLTK